MTNCENGWNVERGGGAFVVTQFRALRNGWHLARVGRYCALLMGMRVVDRWAKLFVGICGITMVFVVVGYLY